VHSPADEPAGPHFALLGKIAARNGVEKLSMGMSGDFETAVRFGGHQRPGRVGPVWSSRLERVPISGNRLSD